MAGTTLTAKQIMKELPALGSESYKRTMLRHGAVEPYYGVKIEYLKQYQKRIKKNYELALELYETGCGDAMYLAGLIADEDRMTKKDLTRWVRQATWSMISEYTVPWVAADGPWGYELATEWIESDDDMIAAAGWATLACVVSVKPDKDLDLKGLEKLLSRVQKSIHKSPDSVKYRMNEFVISVGSYVIPLSDRAIAAARAIGKVDVDMGDTCCKVPDAEEYIAKVAKKKRIGRKRATARC